MTREKHLEWCKGRALEYIERGDLQGAFASMTSDLGKHDETKGHPSIQLGMGQLMMGLLSTPEQMAEFIRGFN